MAEETQPERARQGKPQREGEGGDDFLIVGIGASAGGIAALKGFCEALPAKADMALVVILHLDPKAHSTLAELLAMHAKVPVQVVRDGIALRPQNIYVIPPGHDLDVRDGHLAVTPQRTAGIRLPVDHFLRSLAGSCHERAAAVILSGSGTDGSLGVRTVKEKGGLTVAQDPTDAEYDSMPRSAIATGAIDRVLPARDIPATLIDYGQRRPSAAAPADDAASTEAQAPLSEIVTLLKRHKAHNFAPYKPGTLLRRVSRRMALNQCERMADYIELVRKRPDELDALFKDALINVTGFFRDAEAFAHLERRVAPDLVARHSGDRPLRVWVPGCSTGEEAYSLGILLIEAMTAANRPIRLQIFATDVDTDALETARRGIYPESIASDISPERLNRFFAREERSYVVRPFLRECVVVSSQNVLTDPPFSNLDMISCRNLMIYLKPEMQDQVLRLFHFALKPDGVLFLGSSENVRSEAARFEAVSANYRMFKRVGPRTLADLQLPVSPGLTARARQVRVSAPGARPSLDLVALGQRLVLDTYAPPSVIVDEHYAGMFYIGAVDRFLRIAGGEESHSLVEMAREGLRAKLRAALEQAKAGDGNGLAEGALVERGGQTVSVNIAVKPLRTGEERFFLVTFIEAPAAGAVTPPSPAESGRVAELERELEATRTELRSMIGDLEAANEELRTANADAMSINEEFQSANEELETSKEELQSVNEELSTVNAELQERVEAQRRAADDLANLLASADIATMFLDRNMRIRFFTPAVRRLFPIVAGDIGRSLADFVPQLDDPKLLADAARVLETLVPVPLEIETAAGHWFSRRIAPYRMGDGRIDGVVVSYLDVTEIKRAEGAAQDAKTYAENIVATVRDPLVVLDADLKVVTAGRSFYRVFGLQPANVEGRHFRDIGSGRLNIDPILDLLERILPEHSIIEDMEAEIELAGLGRRAFLFNAREVVVERAARRLILVSLEDMTGRRNFSLQFYRDFLNAAPDAVLVADRKGLIREVNPLLEAMFGYGPDELRGMSVETLIPARLRARHRDFTAAFFAAPRNRLIGEGLGLQIIGRRKDGTEMPLQISLGALRGGEGSLAIAVIRDLAAHERESEDARITAERANRLKSAFLDTTARSLIRPLQTLGLLAQILGRTVTPRDALDVISRLDLLVNGMTNSVNLLLDVNRLNAGEIVPEVTDFPIHDTIERMRAEFNATARRRDLDLRIVSSNAVVRSDRQIVDRILQNLLSNALRFTRAGRVLVGCRRFGDRLSIEVWGTGPGIPSDAMGRIFGEYERVVRPETEPEEGLGLGLYVAKRLADLMGHRLDARSVPGRGSVFALDVPVVAADAPKVADRREPDAYANGTPKVLVISGDPETRRSLEILLRLEGYDVRAVDAPAEMEAELAVQGASRMCLVFDEAAAALSAGGLKWALQHASARGPRSILMTNNPATDHVQDFIDAGVTVLSKPVKANDLVAHVVRVFAALGVSSPKRTSGPAGQPAVRREDDRPTIAVAIGNPELAAQISQVLVDAGVRSELFRSSDELLSSAAAQPPSCVVLGVRLAGLGIAEIIAQLSQHSTGAIPVILMTLPGSIGDAVAGMRAGAVEVMEVTTTTAPDGSVQREFDARRLLETVERGAAQRRRTLDHSHAVAEARERLAPLTTREREVVTLLGAGHSNKEIATRLGLSLRTVENHRLHIRAKTRMRSLAELVQLLELIHDGV